MGGELRELYDLVVVGGGPAGAAAALRALQHKASVLLLEKEQQPRPPVRAGWLGPAGMELCKACGLTAKKAGAARFAGLRLHSWDLKRSTSVQDRELRGWLVIRTVFDAALWNAAAHAGALGLAGVEVQELNLGEDRAILCLSDGRTAAGRVVLIADGAASPTAQMAYLATAAQQSGVPQGAFADYETKQQVARLDVVIGANRAGRLATIVRLGETICVGLVTRAVEEPVEQQLQALCDQAIERGLLPAAGRGTPTRCVCPAGVALDMETHVGKRCLLIGEAGGFVATFSHEEIYPAMRSGWIAADAALRALRAPVLQDELASFGVAWRTELADYLRMPNTDLSLLAPLVFNNEQMSRRVARAFLLGQPF